MIFFYNGFNVFFFYRFYYYFSGYYCINIICDYCKIYYCCVIVYYDN